jgi:Spy/CpxP family protein refolding chaperone
MEIATMRMKLTALLAAIMTVGIFAASTAPANACWHKKGWGAAEGAHAGWWGHKKRWKHGW